MNEHFNKLTKIMKKSKNSNMYIIELKILILVKLFKADSYYGTLKNMNVKNLHYFRLRLLSIIII
jgi:hypothetical protein